MHIPLLSILELSVPELWTTRSYHISNTLNGRYEYKISCDPKPPATIFDPESSIHYATFMWLYDDD